MPYHDVMILIIFVFFLVDILNLKVRIEEELEGKNERVERDGRERKLGREFWCIIYYIIP